VDNVNQTGFFKIRPLFQRQTQKPICSDSIKLYVKMKQWMDICEKNNGDFPIIEVCVLYFPTDF